MPDEELLELDELLDEEDEEELLELDEFELEELELDELLELEEDPVSEVAVSPPQADKKNRVAKTEANLKRDCFMVSLPILYYYQILS